MVEGDKEQDIDVVQRLIGNVAWRLHSGVLGSGSRHWGILGARIACCDLILLFLGISCAYSLSVAR